MCIHAGQEHFFIFFHQGSPHCQLLWRQINTRVARHWLQCWSDMTARGTHDQEKKTLCMSGCCISMLWQHISCQEKSQRLKWEKVHVNWEMQSQSVQITQALNMWSSIVVASRNHCYHVISRITVWRDTVTGIHIPHVKDCAPHICVLGDKPEETIVFEEMNLTEQANHIRFLHEFWLG